MSVVVTSLINAPIPKIWAAITQPEIMRLWYFENIPDFKAELGFKTKFKMQSDKRVFTTNWEVIKVIPFHELTYNWSYDEYEGLGPVTFKLLPRNGKTLLTVINNGLETFPSSISEFTEQSCRGGWEYFIQTRLPEYLSK